MLNNKQNEHQINQFLDHLMQLSYNKKCADCGRTNPSWATITYAFFICYDCSSLHRNLGPGISKVKSTQMDSWSIEELRRMFVGGNKNVYKLESTDSTDIVLKYKNNTSLVQELDRLMSENKKLTGNDFMNLKADVISVSKAKIEKKAKPKFSDWVESTEEDIVEPTKEIEINKEEPESEEEEFKFKLTDKPGSNLKKSVNPARSPFSFSVKEIEENDE